MARLVQQFDSYSHTQDYQMAKYQYPNYYSKSLTGISSYTTPTFYFYYNRDLIPRSVMGLLTCGLCLDWHKSVDTGIRLKSSIQYDASIGLRLYQSNDFCVAYKFNFTYENQEGSFGNYIKYLRDNFFIGIGKENSHPSFQLGYGQKHGNEIYSVTGQVGFGEEKVLKLLFGLKHFNHSSFLELYYQQKTDMYARFLLNLNNLEKTSIRMDWKYKYSPLNKTDPHFYYYSLICEHKLKEDLTLALNLHSNISEGAALSISNIFGNVFNKMKSEEEINSNNVEDELNKFTYLKSKNLPGLSFFALKKYRENLNFIAMVDLQLVREKELENISPKFNWGIALDLNI